MRNVSPEEITLAYINAVGEYNHTEYPDPHYDLTKHIGVRIWELINEGERPEINTSTDLCKAANDAFQGYGVRKGFDWRSFFNGVQEGFALRISKEALDREKPQEAQK